VYEILFLVNVDLFITNGVAFIVNVEGTDTPLGTIIK
jgi:hypothetical protein